MSQRESTNLYYATRARGRSKGKLHTERDCRVISDIPDKDIIDRPRWAFDPDQDECSYCGASK